MTHVLTWQAMIFRTNYIWDDDPSSFIIQLLSQDVTIFNQ